MVHQLNGHEFEQTPGDGEGQGSWHAAVQTVRHEWAHLTTPVLQADSLPSEPPGKPLYRESF